MIKLTESIISSIRAEAQMISSWEEWEEFSSKWFSISEWPERVDFTSDEKYDEEPLMLNGILWERFYSFYAIEPAFEALYEDIRRKIFNQLEPEAAEENALHPELYGKACYYDKIWTREFAIEVCPLCGNELLSFPLNENS